jgi:3-phenylpropionate/trans-cinnamate dioxygenase ferredoxin reductase subunit
VRVVDGELFGGDRYSAQACQSRIISDVSLVCEDVPDVTTTSGEVTMLRMVAPDVVDLCIVPRHPIEQLPGQYLQVQFRGFPMRCYSPTAPLDRVGDSQSFHLHIRRVPNGRVSSALGTTITPGHRVKLKGPFGTAYLRPNMHNRLVLVAGGTGFAPVWSITDGAMRENSYRELVLIVGARSIESLYMIPALLRLATCPHATIIPVTNVPQTQSPAIRTGQPTDYLPELHEDDIVYAAGAPGLVEAVKAVAEAAGAMWYADPFVPNFETQAGLLSRAVNWLTGEAQIASPPMIPLQPPRTPPDIVRETATAEPLAWRAPPWAGRPAPPNYRSQSSPARATSGRRHR